MFIRELISNASDALEKLRYIQVTKQEAITDDLSLEIHIATDEEKKTLTIQVWFIMIASHLWLQGYT